MGANDDLIAEAREYADAIQGGENENWMRLVACVDSLADALESALSGKLLARMNHEWTVMANERNAALARVTEQQAVIERVKVALRTPGQDTQACDSPARVVKAAMILSTSGTEALEADTLGPRRPGCACYLWDQDCPSHPHHAENGEPEQ